jgi:hypothetical protein
VTTWESLAALVSAYADGASVPVPKSWLQELLSGIPTREPSPAEVEVDLDCGQVAALLGRSPGTIRSWCAAGVIPDAYRLRGCREWRVPRIALTTFQQRERQRAARSA